MELPDGLTARPLTEADAAAVTAVMAASQVSATGSSWIQEADLLADWARPSFDLASSTTGVFAGPQLVGYAEISSPGRGDASVHPEHEGRGIGTALARWMQETARARGHHETGMPVPQGSSAERLLRALGYHVRWESWILQLPVGREITLPRLPAGYQVRQAGPEDAHAAYDVVEDAFLEWAVRDRETWEDWSAEVLGRPGFEPWNLQVATDPSGTVVGAVQVFGGEDGTGFVDKLAVRADQRRRGLARALLAAAFASARGAGYPRAELSTDSRTGALDLYTGLDMEVASTWLNLGISLE